MRNLDTYRGARRNAARDGAGIQTFRPTVRPYNAMSTMKLPDRRLHIGRHIIRTEKIGGRERQLHATKGWRSRRA